MVFYLDFEGAMNIQVLKILIWDFRGHWRVLTRGWQLNLDLDRVTGFWYSNVPNGCSLSCFWRFKEHPCPLSPHLGFWRTLDVLDWGLTSWSWFGYGHWSLVDPCSEFWLYILILKVQRISMSFKSSIGALCYRFLTGIWHLDLDLDTVAGLWYNNDQNFGSLS